MSTPDCFRAGPLRLQPIEFFLWSTLVVHPSCIRNPSRLPLAATRKSYLCTGSSVVFSDPEPDLCALLFLFQGTHCTHTSVDYNLGFGTSPNALLTPLQANFSRRLQSSFCRFADILQYISSQRCKLPERCTCC